MTRTRPVERPGQRVRRLLLGPPISSSQEQQERLGKPTALAILSGDALSSVAYATEAMVRVLIPAIGVAAFSYVLPTSAVIIALLVTLVFSYRQTIRAYPTAGGAYVVSRDNFGMLTAQIAGVGLLLDYILTVAVSVSAGVAAVYSVFPAFFPYRVFAAVALIWMITWVNLRGLRMTGKVFAAPTYLFIATILGLVVAGVIQLLVGDIQPIQPPPNISGVTGTAGLFLLMHAYASGTTALTGVEAISNGVSIFRPVEWRNARTVLMWMGAILAVMFGGVAFLTSRLHPVPTQKQTLLSELARAIFGGRGPGAAGYLLVQITTTLILIFAANTSFADFPRLASFQARDGYLPASFRRRGPRLVFSTGIVVLASFATVITVVLGARVESLIPLYAVGAFSAFTFSQAGMTVRHLRLREEGWRHSLAINGLGAVLSGFALLVILVAKFSEGAWVALVVIPSGVYLVTSVRRHYVRVERRLAHAKAAMSPHRVLEVVVVVSALDEALERAMRYLERLQALGRIHPVCLAGRDPALGAAFEARYHMELRFKRRGVSQAEQVRRIARGLRRGHAERVVLVLLPEKLDRKRRWFRVEPSGSIRFRRAICREHGIALVFLPTAPDDDSLLSDRPARHVAIVPVDSTDVVAEQAIVVGRLVAADHAKVVHFDIDQEETTYLQHAWRREEPGIQLRLEPAPFRELGEPLLSLVRDLRRGGHAFVTVVLGQLIPRWWQRPLHVDEVDEVRSALRREPGTALIVVPYAL